VLQKNTFKYSRLFWLIVIIAGVLTSEATLLSNSQIKLIPSKYSKNQYEIHKILFYGNSSFISSDLDMLISQKTSGMTLPHQMLSYFEDELKKNPSTPKYYLRHLKYTVDKYRNEISFYNDLLSQDDASAIQSFYNIQGWHFCEVNYNFGIDSTSSSNILSFKINEGERYKIGSIKYFGLDSLPSDVQKDLQKKQVLDTGIYFNESLIISQMEEYKKVLLNKGYFYVKYRILPVQMDTTKKIDYISVKFVTGKRQIVGYYTYSADNKGYKGLAKSIKDKYNQIKPNNWYNEEKIKQTEKNLSSLGLFEKISIDTINITSTDTLNFNIFTQLRDRYEVEAGYSIFHTPQDGYINSGFAGSMTVRNPFGASEAFSIYGNTAIKDIDNIFSGKKIELEGKIGAEFTQPLLFLVGTSRISGNINVEYSRNTLNGFIVDRWYLPKFSLPWYFRSFTFYNKMQFDLSLEGEFPRNYGSIVDTSGIADDSGNFMKDSIFYYTLSNYWNSPAINRTPWSAAIAGLTVKGDHRDHPYSPKKGYLTLLSFDGAGLIGIAEYFRLQFMHQHFFSQTLHPNKVHALKFKFGFILFDRNNTNKYVPYDKQFFVGGANSNRGWPARQLHASKIVPIETASKKDSNLISFADYALFSNIYGNSGVFEATYEYRYNFIAPKGFSRSFADQIASLGLVAFADIGNGFRWFADKKDKPLSNSVLNTFNYFIENLAVSTGIGIRYETIIGPLRLDIALPVYGPIPGKDRLIFNRYSPFDDIAFHFGIGHAF